MLSVKTNKMLKLVNGYYEHDILLVGDHEPDHNRVQAGYINQGGAKQMTALPGNDF